MFEKIQACSFTGHRPQSYPFGYDESDPGYQKLRTRIKNALIQVCNAGCRTFYCGMAEGADLWCGELILEMKDQFSPPLEICAVVPFLSQPASMTKINQERYRKIMDSAKARYLVSRNFTKNCYQKRNYYLVDACDVLIAVFDENNTKSGTAQTVRYAKRKKKRIVLIPITEKSAL